MPLSAPQPRKPIHTRAIECKGYERDDGLWDIEAHLVDTKSYVHTRRTGDSVRQPGQPVHDMWIRLTIDLDMVIHDAEAHTDDGPYPTCGNITPNFKTLIGVKIGPGWRLEVGQRLGRTKGCTHLVELLWPLATTAFQATGRPLSLTLPFPAAGPAAAAAAAGSLNVDKDLLADDTVPLEKQRF